MTPDYQQPRSPSLSPLTTLRIIWAALLLGQLAFFLVIALLSQTPPSPPPDPNLLHILYLAEWLVLLIALPTAYLLRHLLFSKSQRDDGTLPRQHFATGTILFLALLEGTSFFGLVVTLLARQLLPYALVPLLALLIQLLNFPLATRLSESDR